MIPYLPRSRWAAGPQSCRRGSDNLFVTWIPIRSLARRKEDAGLRPSGYAGGIGSESSYWIFIAPERRAICSLETVPYNAAETL
jgi:hypothetical protein